MKIKPKPAAERDNWTRRNSRLPQLNKASRLMRRFWGPSEMILAAMQSDSEASQRRSERGAA